MIKKPFFVFAVFYVFLNVYCQEYTTVIKEFKHDNNVFSVVFSPDGKQLASGSEDKTMKLWNIEEEELLHTFEGHFSTINDIAFHPKGKYIYSAGDKTIRIWKPEGAYINNLRGHRTYIWSISTTSDGNKVATGSFEEDFYFWDMINTSLIKTFSGHKKSVLSVDISPDDNHIASGSLDETIKLWDIRSGNEIRTGYGHSGNIYDIEFSPDGKYLVTASGDNTLKLWDVLTFNQVRTFKGHKEAVMAVNFSPDGLHILSASYDKTIRLWEVHSGETVFVYNNPEDAVNTVRFSPDGKYFASGGNDNKAMVYELDHRIFVDREYREEMEKEMEESGLAAPKQDDENRSEYKERLEKAEEFKQILYNKYYKMYIEKLKNIDKKGENYEIRYDKEM